MRQRDPSSPMPWPPHPGRGRQLLEAACITLILFFALLTLLVVLASCRNTSSTITHAQRRAELASAQLVVAQRPSGQYRIAEAIFVAPDLRFVIVAWNSNGGAAFEWKARLGSGPTANASLRHAINRSLEITAEHTTFAPAGQKRMALWCASEDALWIEAPSIVQTLDQLRAETPELVRVLR